MNFQKVSVKQINEFSKDPYTIPLSVANVTVTVDSNFNPTSKKIVIVYICSSQEMTVQVNLNSLIRLPITPEPNHEQHDSVPSNFRIITCFKVRYFTLINYLCVNLKSK